MRDIMTDPEFWVGFIFGIIFTIAILSICFVL